MRIPRFSLSLSEAFPSETLEQQYKLRDFSIPQGKELVLSRPQDVHHLVHVLRAQPSMTVEIFFTDAPIVVQARYLRCEGNQAILCVLAVSNASQQAGIHIVAGLPKSNTADHIVEKAVELGVSSIVFFLAERTQGRLDASAREKKQQRFSRVAVAAQKQSGSAIIPEVRVEEGLPTAMRYCQARQQAGDLRILLTPPLLAESRQLPKITDIFLGNSSANTNLEKAARNVDTYIVLGPEGGLTEAENDLAKEFAYREVSLSQNTLRCDTAAMLAVALVALLREA